MALIAIAHHTCGEEVTIGFRILDTHSREIRDLNSSQVFKMIATGNHILNLKIQLENRELVGYNGSIEKLPQLICNKVIGESPIIIIYELRNYGYAISDYLGQIEVLSYTDALQLAINRGVSNGAVVDKKYIRSIKGSYPIEDRILHKDYEPTPESKRLKILGVHSIDKYNQVITINEYVDESKFTGKYKVIGYMAEDGVSLQITDTSITQLEIPYTVRKIGDFSFKHCSRLKEVIIPKSIIEIGREAFRECTSLKSIIIPDSVRTIGEEAFQFCTALEVVEISHGVTSIGKFAFSKCKSLKSISLPSSIVVIEEYILESCESLESIEIPISIRQIKKSAFQLCKSLRYIRIPNRVTIIGSMAFIGCISLGSMELPDTLEEIGDNAFNRCTRLGQFIIPMNPKFSLSKLPKGVTLTSRKYKQH